MRLENKNIIVTGASSGMGKEIVKLFTHEGANVLAVARREERLQSLKNEVANEKGKYSYFVGDVSNEDSVNNMIDCAVKEFGSLDVLINCAGVMDDMSAIGDATSEKYNFVYNVNVFGPFLSMKKAVNVFLKQGKGGNIINVSSIGSMHQAAGAIYCSSKAALNALSINTAFMYKNDGIRCNVIAPGSFKTEIATSMGQPNVDGYKKVAPIIGLAPEPQDPIEIAKVALFLASDDSSFVNGEIIKVDGGWTTF